MMSWTQQLARVICAGSCALATGCSDPATEQEPQTPTTGNGAASSTTGTTPGAPVPTEGTVSIEDTRAATGDCSFDVEYELSPTIGTVGIVRWSTDLEALSTAYIEFVEHGSNRRLTAPVNLDRPDYRTLLLGMKGARSYRFRILATDGVRGCSSPPFEITTRPLPNSIPSIQRRVLLAGQSEPGFIVTSAGIGGFGAGLGSGAGDPAFIMDSDGDVVWYWLQAPPMTSRARLAWDAQSVWMLSANVTGGTGRVSQVSLDGLDFVPDVAGLEDSHHDLTVLPDGSVASIAHIGDCSGILQRHPDGSVETLVSSIATLYRPKAGILGDTCHPNSIMYHRKDDSFTLSDRNANALVKLTRGGELLWQLGGEQPLADHYPAAWNVNHGHQLLDDGHLLLFANGNPGESSTALEYELDHTTHTATLVWDYTGGPFTPTLGDVQRLPGGNTLVVYSNAGLMHEVAPDGRLVQEISTDSLGYAMFRKSLYAAPLR